MSTWQPILKSFAGPSKPFYGYKLDLNDDEIHVHFSGLKPPYYNKNTIPYSFVEGLWRYDCGELWICNPKNGRYIELNLAPNGCWWSCVFALPRLRDGKMQVPRCVPDSTWDEHAWFANMKISWEEVERCIGSRQDLIGNITLVEDGCPDKSPPLENLHSVVDLGAVDFHRPEDWVPLVDLVNLGESDW